MQRSGQTLIMNSGFMVKPLTTLFQASVWRSQKFTTKEILMAYISKVQHSLRSYYPLTSVVLSIGPCWAQYYRQEAPA